MTNSTVLIITYLSYSKSFSLYLLWPSFCAVELTRGQRISVDKPKGRIQLFLIQLDRHSIKVLGYLSALVTCSTLFHIVPHKLTTRPMFGLFAFGHPQHTVCHSGCRFPNWIWIQADILYALYCAHQNSLKSTLTLEEYFMLIIF